MGQGIHKIEICLRGDLRHSSLSPLLLLLQEKAKWQFTRVTIRVFQILESKKIQFSAKGIGIFAKFVAPRTF